MTGVVDYGAGNLRSVQKALEYLGEGTVVSSEKRELDKCDRLILPGVGSFKAGMEGLKRTGFDAYISARAADTPVLGICLGMQFLLQASEEDGLSEGLKLISGRAVRFTQGKIPHIGWNAVYDLKSPLFEGINEGTPFYFVHSYYATTVGQEVYAKTEYHREFASAIGKGLLYGVQFHPEKSGDMGLVLLKNFLRI